MPFKKSFEVGLRTQLLPQTPYSVYSLGLWEWQKISEFYFCSDQNVFQLLPKKNTKDI